MEWYPMVIGVLQVMFLIGLGMWGVKLAKSDAVKAWCGVAFQVLGVQFVCLKLWEFAQIFGFLT